MYRWLNSLNIHAAAAAATLPPRTLRCSRAFSQRGFTLECSMQGAGAVAGHMIAESLAIKISRKRSQEKRG